MLEQVKSLLGLPTAATERVTTQSLRQVDRTIKSDNTQDRDANGQQLYEKEQKKRNQN